MNSLNVKKGDNVIVLAGKDKGKKGTVIKAHPKTETVVVEGINVITKHVKPLGSAYPRILLPRLRQAHESGARDSRRQENARLQALRREPRQSGQGDRQEGKEVGQACKERRGARDRGERRQAQEDRKTLQEDRSGQGGVIRAPGKLIGGTHSGR